MAKNDGVTWLQLYSQVKIEQTKLVKRKSNRAKKERKKKWKHSVYLPFTKKFWSYAAAFSEDKLFSRRYVGKSQFSSTMGLGNKMKLKLRLPILSLVRIRCLCVLCFWFYNLQSLSKCLYTLTVWLGILAHSNPISGIMLSVDWLENITISLARSVISGQSDMETNSSRYGFIRIQFEIVFFSQVCEFHL